MADIPDIQHDLVAWGHGLRQFLEPHVIDENPNLLYTARIVKRLEMIDAELIYRHRLTGSALKAYREGKTVCGVTLRPGMNEWDEFESPIFTPTTKAKEGHDLPMDASDFSRQYGNFSIHTGQRAFEWGIRELALHGFIMADTKLELGWIQSSGHCPKLVIGDELFTPDSSRFVTAEEIRLVQSGQKPKPDSYDKQEIRDWVETELGFGPKSTLTDDAIARIHNSEIPPYILALPSAKYAKLFQMIVGDMTCFINNLSDEVHTY